MVMSGAINISMRKIFKNEFDAFQEKCANLQSTTVNATPALTAAPARVAWSPTTATVRSVSIAPLAS